MNIFKLFHICFYTKPIVSRYVSFLTREIVFECRCGKRKIEKVYRAFDVEFPIHTTTFITQREMQEIANRTASQELEQLYLQILNR